MLVNVDLKQTLQVDLDSLEMLTTKVKSSRLLHSLRSSTRCCVVRTNDCSHLVRIHRMNTRKGNCGT